MISIRIPLLLMVIVIGMSLHVATAQARDIQTAIFAGGCFWCVEADFDKVPGVISTVSGYTGGSVANPSYKQVSKGNTGHFEAVQIRFDADKTSYRELVDIFWRTIDPLDAGGQFCDRGAPYRTAVFVSGLDQRTDAEASKAAADALISGRIVTPILPASAFFPAEDVHQNYYRGTKRVITRFGVIQMKDAYKRYRKACGRDKRVREIWGNAAPFAKGRS